MKKLLFIFIVYFFTVFLSSCFETITDDHTETPSESKVYKPKTAELAFLEVVKVLHAPYDQGSLFFKIFTGSIPIRESKNGNESEIGESINVGSGTWTVTAGKDNNIGGDNSIIYEYNKYQPKGSALSITGTMAAMYRCKGFDNAHAIGFHQSSSSHPDDAQSLSTMDAADAIMTAINTVRAKDTLIETLKIDGAYDATLTFIYSNTSSDVMAFNYDELLFGDTIGMFTSLGSKIEFHYNNHTLTLNKEQLKSLLKVNCK